MNSSTLDLPKSWIVLAYEENWAPYNTHIESRKYLCLSHYLLPRTNSHW